MNLGIKGKKALITGGSSSLAQLIAVDLAKEGALIALISKDKKAGDKALQLLGDAQGSECFISDLIKEGESEKCAKDVKDKFGHADIVVNVLEDSSETTNPYCSIEDWRKIFQINCEVAITLNNQFIPAMKKKDWGRIVNVSSTAAVEHTGSVQYSSTKAALTAYTRCMGRVLAVETTNVVMSAVLPGALLTEDGYWADILKKNKKQAQQFLDERCPLKRFGKPEEISPLVAMLCSEQATYCQGAIIPIDGGQSRHFMQLKRD